VSLRKLLVVVRLSLGQRPASGFRVSFRETHPVDQVSAGNMELRGISGSQTKPRATSEGQKVETNRTNQADYVNSMTNVNLPSSAIGIARGGKAPSRILPVEGDQLRAVGPQPRSESTGGATTSPGGDPPRRRWQIRESGDVGGRGTPGREPELVAVESGKYLHHPDEGATEFTTITKDPTEPEVCRYTTLL